MTQEQKISFFKIKRLSIYIFFCALYNFFTFFLMKMWEVYIVNFFVSAVDFYAFFLGFI